MGKLIFVTIYVFLAFFTSKGESLECIACSSVATGTCYDPLDYWITTDVVCPAAAPGMKPACVTREVQDGAGGIIVNRGCTMVPASYTGMTCPLGLSLYLNQLSCRVCYRDRCNGASVPRLI